MDTDADVHVQNCVSTDSDLARSRGLNLRGETCAHETTARLIHRGRRRCGGLKGPCREVSRKRRQGKDRWHCSLLQGGAAPSLQLLLRDSLFSQTAADFGATTAVSLEASGPNDRSTCMCMLIHSRQTLHGRSTGAKDCASSGRRRTWHGPLTKKSTLSWSMQVNLRALGKRLKTPGQIHRCGHRYIEWG